MLGDVASACRHAPAPLGQQGDRCPLEGDGLRTELGQVRAQLEPAGAHRPLPSAGGLPCACATNQTALNAGLTRNTSEPHGLQTWRSQK